MRELRPKDTEALEVMEGKVAFVYDDSKYPPKMYKAGQLVGGTLTGGVGHTGGDLAQWIGKTIPDQQIDKWLDEDTDAAKNFVNKNVKVTLNNNQFAALVFWVFNIGVGAAAKSTLIKKLNTGDYDSVPQQLRRWTKTRVNGKMVTSNGLIKRRADEIAYWLADERNIPVPVPHPKDKPTGTQTAELEAPKNITLEGAAAGAGVLATVGGAVTEGPFAYAVAGIAVVAFGIFAYWYVTKRLFPK